MEFTERVYEKLLWASNEGQCKRVLDLACEKCASRNIMHCSCDRCPIEAAYSMKVKNLQLLGKLLKEDN